MFSYRDQIRLDLVSGSGGPGSISFYRSRKNPRGGPDGGDGGDGGDIIFNSESGISYLEHLDKRKKIWIAKNGNSGEGQLKFGKKGKDLKISIPIGTIIRDENLKIIKDFAKKESIVILKGGKGGKGNTFFKTSLNQAPRQFQKGELGKKKNIILEQKPLADIAIIGKTNVGKSTFLNEITRAKSPTANYPYTTLKPYLGESFIEENKYIFIDIPGLSKGAHKNLNKGLSFLRSIQRVRLLLHFVDPSTKNPLEDKKEAEEELKLFDKKFFDPEFTPLFKKIRFLVFSKWDQVENKKIFEKLFENNKYVFKISCHKKKGIEKLLQSIHAILDKNHN